MKQPSKTTFLGQIKLKTMSDRVVKGLFRDFLAITKDAEKGFWKYMPSSLLLVTSQINPFMGN